MTRKKQTTQELTTFIVLYQTKLGQLKTFEKDDFTAAEAASEPPDFEGGVALGALEIHPDDLSAHERGDFARMKLHTF